MKNELISMVAYVLLGISECYKDTYEYNTQYATFLNTPLNISMFVPAIKVGDKWEVLEMPIKPSYDNQINRFLHQGDLEQYQTAKEQCLFEGWTLANETQSVWAVYDSDSRLIFIKEDGECLDGKTIQDLIKYKPTLTKKGLEVSGLNR